MKIRIKFAKQGVMRFIGHLDIMRYFQKAMRRAHIDIAFTEGFSPHMIMSFAAPLGVGLTSNGEYMDIEIKSPIASADAVRQLNEVMVEGMEVLSFRQIEEGKAGKAIVHIVTKSTLDYLNKGGLTYGVSVDGASPIVVNFNDNLNEKPENIYDIYYPTIARRVVDKTIVVDVQPTADGNHTITLIPNDPAIVFEKIIIDYRPNGGRVSHL